MVDLCKAKYLRIWIRDFVYLDFIEGGGQCVSVEPGLWCIDRTVTDDEGVS